MKDLLKLTTAAAALAGSALFCAPADAAYVGIGVGPVGFDIYSGGYCDRWGCPRDYWTYPIYYGPVYYDNVWYRGPVYYRTAGNERWYWIHGGWHRDQWRGLRPTWARYYHYGPALGLDYYRDRGFRVREGDWRAWQDRDYRYRTDYRNDDRGAYYGNDDRYRNEDHYRDYDMDRGRGYDNDVDRDRGYDRNTDRNNGPDRDYDRERGTYEHSGSDRDYDRDTGRNDRDQMGPDDRARYHGNAGPNDESRDRDRSGAENGYQHSNYQQPTAEHGHAKPPPVTSRSAPRSRPASNSDDGDNGPTD